MELNITFFIQLTLILLVIVGMSQLVFQPMLRLFDEREKRMEGASKEAHLLSGKAEEQNATVDMKMREAHDGVRAVLNDMRAQGQAKERVLVESARREADQKLQKARADLAKSTDEARRALHKEAEKFSDEIVAKVLGRQA